MMAIYEPLNYGIIAVHGQDATAFLQGQVTCDITQLNEQTCQLGACCNTQGRVQALFWAFKTPTHYLLCLPQNVVAHFLSLLQKYKLSSKVVLEILPWQVGCLMGAPSFPVPQENYAVVQHEKGLVAKIPGTPARYLMLSPTSPVSLPTPVFPHGWQYQNILAGLPQVYADTVGLWTPHELNLIALHAVNFDKGCYKGQEIVARMHYRGKPKQHMYPIEYHAEQKLPNGAALYDKNQYKIGQVIELCETPSPHAYIGLAVLLDTFSQNPIDNPNLCLLTTESGAHLNGVQNEE